MIGSGLEMVGSESEKGCEGPGGEGFGDWSAVLSLHPGMQPDGVRGDSVAPGDTETTGGQQQYDGGRLLQAGATNRGVPSGGPDGGYGSGRLIGGGRAVTS